VIDSLGSTHVLTVTFTKTDVNQWDYEITIPGDDVTAGTPGEPFSIITGSVTFDERGRLISPDQAAGPVNFTISGLASGAEDLEVNWVLYQSDGTPTLTQYAQVSAVAAVSQDGLPPFAVW
jgi:flagellar hook protein FlgE